MEGIAIPRAIVDNVAKLMSVDAKGAEYYVRHGAQSIVRAYDVRGNKYLWTQVDAQVLAWLLDPKTGAADARVQTFQTEHKATALSDLEEFEAWSQNATKREMLGLMNMPLWLWYAFGTYSSFAEWKKYADVIHKNTQIGALRYIDEVLMGAILRALKDLLSRLVKWKARLDEGGNFTESERAKNHARVFGDAQDDVIAIMARDMLVDAVLRAEDATLSQPILERLTAMREELRRVIAERGKSKVKEESEEPSAAASAAPEPKKDGKSKSKSTKTATPKSKKQSKRAGDDSRETKEVDAAEPGSGSDSGSVSESSASDSASSGSASASSSSASDAAERRRHRSAAPPKPKSHRHSSHRHRK